MRKKYFPKTYVPAITRSNPRPKTVSTYRYNKSKKSCRNLRHEFDIIMRKNHTILTSDQLDDHWKKISKLLIEAPNLTIEELIGTLDL